MWDINRLTKWDQFVLFSLGFALNSIIFKLIMVFKADETTLLDVALFFPFIIIWQCIIFLAFTINTVQPLANDEAFDRILHNLNMQRILNGTAIIDASGDHELFPRLPNRQSLTTSTSDISLIVRY